VRVSAVVASHRRAFGPDDDECPLCPSTAARQTEVPAPTDSRPAPYVSAVHQAPVQHGREEFALHIALFSTLLAPDRLQHLAGSELGMGCSPPMLSPKNRQSGCANSDSSCMPARVTDR
jgi:hypothetical protein